MQSLLSSIIGEFEEDDSFSIEAIMEEVCSAKEGSGTSMLVEDPGSEYGNRSQRSKEDYVTWMKQKTKHAAISIVNLMEKTASSPGLNVVRFQLIKSSTSTAANYRAACRARSANEFYAKMCIVVEEADETQFWLEILNESDIKVEKGTIQKHPIEWTEIVKIVTSAKAAARKKR
jgi:four helix bundle protein